MSVGGRLSAPSQAVSYHVTSLAASQLLVSRGNAALGSHMLLLCLVCGVRSLGSLLACRRHRRVAQVHERRSAATMGGLAALSISKKLHPGCEPEPSLSRFEAGPAPTVRLLSTKLFCCQHTVRCPWAFSILRLVELLSPMRARRFTPCT